MKNVIDAANKPHTETQAAQIIKHLKKGKKITSLEALKMFGCSRLGARVLELKEIGHDIQGKMINVKTVHGIKSVKQYFLRKSN